MTNRFRWYRYSVAIVGQESGNISPPLGFVRFRHQWQAQRWVDIQNVAINREGYPELTKYKVVPMP